MARKPKFIKLFRELDERYNVLIADVEKGYAEAIAPARAVYREKMAGFREDEKKAIENIESMYAEARSILEKTYYSEIDPVTKTRDEAIDTVLRHRQEARDRLQKTIDRALADTQVCCECGGPLPAVDAGGAAYDSPAPSGSVCDRCFLESDELDPSGRDCDGQLSEREIR